MRNTRTFRARTAKQKSFGQRSSFHIYHVADVPFVINNVTAMIDELKEAAHLKQQNGPVKILIKDGRPFYTGVTQ